jgi:hypothetical protein
MLNRRHAALLGIVAIVAAVAEFTYVYAAPAGPFRLAVVQGNWVEYVVTESVNASAFCYTFAPEASGSSNIIKKPLNQGDRIKAVIKYMSSGQGTHERNGTIVYTTEGSALTDLYLNGQMLWSAQGSLGYYRPMGLDFHYVVGDGYWDTIERYGGYGGCDITVGDPNVTLSYSYEEGGRVDCNIVINGNTGIVLESSRVLTDISPGGKCQLSIVDTNVAGIIPEFPSILAVPLFMVVATMLTLLAGRPVREREQIIHGT